jgi:hypothetical protein
LSTHLRLCLPSGLLPSGFPTNILYAFLFSPIHTTFALCFVKIWQLVQKFGRGTPQTVWWIQKPTFFRYERKEVKDRCKIIYEKIKWSLEVSPVY